jgi:hypothetical protein
VWRRIAGAAIRAAPALISHGAPRLRRYIPTVFSFGGLGMKPSAPVILLFLVSVALLATGLIGWFKPTLLPPEAAENKFWFVVGAWGVLALGSLVRS